MANHYANAIDVLMSNPSQTKLMAMLTAIAKRHPKIVAIAAKETSGMPGRWESAVARLIDEEQFIGAIKEYRRITGTGLKDAKLACDTFRDSGLYRAYL